MKKRLLFLPGYATISVEHLYGAVAKDGKCYGYTGKADYFNGGC